MEAPYPIELNSKIDLKEEIKYLINSDNNIEYNIDLKNFNSFILIHCFYEFEYKKYYFEKKFLLEELKTNKYLAMCDSIDEIYEQLKIEFDKKITNIQKSQESIIIMIPINHIKFKEITFIIPKKIKTDQEKIEDLNNEVSFLKNENDILKTSIENLENQNILIIGRLDKLDILEKENKMLYEKIIKIENIIENMKNSGNDNVINNSKILNGNVESQKLIIKWIKEKTSKNNIKVELIFRKSENGETSEDFHKYCDNQGPTLSIIKTTKNHIIGGFTPLNWVNDLKGISEYDYSNQTFIFSLNARKKYDLIDPNNKKAIYNWIKYGPNFGNGNIRFWSNLNEGICFDNFKCSFIDNGQKELIGEEAFINEELEVFKIIY